MADPSSDAKAGAPALMEEKEVLSWGMVGWGEIEKADGKRPEENLLVWKV